MYYFYLDKILCPIAPSQLQMKIKGQNKTLTLINEGEVNLLKRTGLTEISFDIMLPNVQYPFAVYKSGFQRADYFLEEIGKLKTNSKPFQFIVTRTLPNEKMLFDTNLKVSLEEYTIKEDSKEGFDVVVSVKLKQYREYGTKTCVETTPKQNTQKKTISLGTPKRATENSPAPVKNETYTVQKGDCLWNISKKFYGDGSKYKKLAEVNKIKNANLIYPGQVLTIPAL